MPKLTPLCELAKKHRTDKGGFHLTYGNHTTEICHNYTPIYYELFAGEEELVRRVLEIGVNQGCSQRMWAEHYPNAEVIGLDIDINFLFNEDRIRCFEADQSSPESLLAAMEKAGPGKFDLIVDDGSHDTHHQLISMQTLLPFLADTGYYVIEDLTCFPTDITQHVPKGYKSRVHYCAPGLGRAEKINEPLIVVRREI